MKKVCVCCNKEKDISEFNVSVIDSSGKVYYRPQCRICYNIKLKEYRATHKDVTYRSNHTEHAKLCRKRYREAHKDEARLYKIIHRDEINESQHRHNKTEKRRAYNRAYKKAKRERDLTFKIYCDIKRRINFALGDTRYSGQGVCDILGCDIPFLRAYIERQFQDGMTWENRSLYGWHIDHIRPCASFDLTNPEEQKKCFHYTNLRPLWAKDNLSKGAKLLVA